MRKIILVLALCVCGIASAQAQTSGTNAPPPPVCSASNAGALYTQTSTSPNTVWTCSYYNLQYQWVVNPMYGGLAYYPIVPTTCSGALPVFLAGYPTTTMYVCIQGVPTAVAGGGANITSLTGDATAAGPGAAATTVTGINGAAIQASINVLSTNASKQVVGATYQNVVNLFGSGSCSGYLKSDGTCSTPSSIPTGTTNQLLYYATGGTTVTPLTLGTSLSITSGTLNAAGGVSQIVAGSNVTISPSSGVGAVTINSSGSGNPSSTTYILSGSSVTNDDQNALVPLVAITSWTCTSSTCTWTVSSTTGLNVGSWVLIPGCSTPNADDQGVGFPGCGWAQILSSGLTSTTFETADVASSQSCSSSCGNYMDGDWLLGPQLQQQPNVAGHGTVYWPTCDSSGGGYTLACMAANFATTYAFVPNGTPSSPVYFIIDNFEDDSGVSGMESDLETIWADAHAKGWKVITATTYPHGPAASDIFNVDEWLYSQRENISNKVGGQYTDAILDVASVMGIEGYTSGNGGFTPSGLALYTNKLNAIIAGINTNPTALQMYLRMDQNNLILSYPNEFVAPNWTVDQAGDMSATSLSVSGDPSYSQPLTVIDPQTQGSRNTAWFACDVNTPGSCYIQFGHNQSTNNSISWEFKDNSSGSTSNFFDISPYGGSPAQTLFMDGDTSFGNSTDSGKLLGVGSGNQLTIDASGNLVTTGTITAPNMGTVTSVAQTVPSWLAVAGSPITSSGTLAISAASGQAANEFLATPNGTSGAVGLRAIVAADIPTLNQNTTGNAATATALAATPSQCTSGEFATGIAASGNANCSGVVVTALTTNGTSGAATLASGVLNVPQYQGALTLTTTGTTGAATLSGNTLNIPSYSTISGLTNGYIPVATSATAIGNSHLDDGVTETGYISSSEPINVGTISTNGTSLTLAQTGDMFGSTSLTLENRNGQNGPVFTQYGSGIPVDFGFYAEPENEKMTFRYEIRSGVSNMCNSLNNATGEFQFFSQNSPSYFCAGPYAITIRAPVSTGDTNTTASTASATFEAPGGFYDGWTLWNGTASQEFQYGWRWSSNTAANVTPTQINYTFGFADGTTVAPSIPIYKSWTDLPTGSTVDMSGWAHLKVPSIEQPAANTFGGSCAMSAATTCTITLTHDYATPICIATVQGSTPAYAACSVSGTTVTITASASNSDTWGAMVFGNPN